MSSVQIFWHRHGACRTMRWIIPSFGRGQGLVEIVDYLLRVLEPASAGNKLRLRQILHFIRSQRARYGCEAAFLAGYASLSEIRLARKSAAKLA
ncbi:hypothetical protein [Mesorhizobium sp. M0220]|uniref:hypothetical protein n=1 Tax=Mesorhizobium sp. M0220 TaxID=2956920 RepID=UPI0033396379